MSKSLVEATSGALAACVSTLAVYPLDTLLVHHQASVSKQPGKLLQQQQNQHRSVLQALGDILQELLHQEESSSKPDPSQQQQQDKDRLSEFLNRIGRLYRGLGVKLAEQVARNFVYFYLYQALKSRASKGRGPIGTASTLLLAVAAALGTQLITAPLDVTSTHAQLCRLPLKTIFLRILRTEGLWGFYRGFGASLCLCANPAITNATFDSLKLWLQMVNLLRARRFMDPITDEDTPIEKIGQVLPPLSGLQSFLLGAVSKAVATVATYPYIRAKVLLQARLLQRGANLRGNGDTSHQEQQELALISGGTGASSAPWPFFGMRPQKQTEAGDRQDRKLPRAGSMDPQERPMQQRQQEQTKVPRAVSVQSALDRELDLQLLGVPASAYICSGNLRKPASFCLSDCSEAGGLGICGSSDEGSAPSDSPPASKSRGHSPLSDELLKTIIAASILFLIKEKIQAQTAQTFARVERVFGRRPTRGTDDAALRGPP